MKFKLSHLNPFNLIDLFAPPPEDPFLKKANIRGVSISSIEELNKVPVYRAKTRKLSYAIALALAFDVMGIVFYLDNKDLIEPKIYEVQPTDIIKRNESAYHDKQLIIFDKPRHTEVALQRWVNTVVNDLYNFDFLNFEDRIEHISQYFTKSGFENFVQSLQNIRADENIIDNKLTIKTFVFDKALFPSTYGNKRLSDGNIYYQLNIPMRMTVQKGNVIREFNTNFNILLVLLIDNNGKTGFYIQEFDMDKPSKVINI